MGTEGVVVARSVAGAGDTVSQKSSIHRLSIVNILGR